MNLKNKTINSQENIDHSFEIKNNSKRKSLNFSKMKTIIYLVTFFSVLILLILIGFVIFKSTAVFSECTNFFDFIFKNVWKPGKNGEGIYGIGNIILMTLVLLSITMIFAVPITIFSTLYISEYLSRKNQKNIMMIIKLLAGIPSVVFGLFARQQIGALFKLMGAPTNDNLMVAALTMTFMAIPTMISLSYNAVQSVPDGYRLASLGLGVSKEKTTMSIMRKSASAKIISAIIIGMSRVIGETMAIMMIAGNSVGNMDVHSGLGGFLFSSIRTLAGTIGIEITENYGSQHQSALYAIGLFLFILVFIINIIILYISSSESRKQKRQIKKEELMKIKIDSENQKNSKTKKIGIRYSNTNLINIIYLNAENKIGKRVYSALILMCMYISLIIVISFTGWIIGVVAFRGISGLQYTDSFVSINQSGGILDALLTTIMLIFATLIFAIPLALFTAIYLSEYARKQSKFTQGLKFTINLMASTPSIIFGIFGLSLFIQILGLPFSILAAALTMTIVILPMLISNFEDALSMVEQSHREAGAALGLSKSKIIFTIVLPNALEGIITGALLSIAKIIGESAPVYLTLGTATRMPMEGFLSSGATLTTGIYMLAAESPIGGKAESICFLMSLITIIFVFTINISSRRLSSFLTSSNKTKVSISLWFKDTILNIKNFKFKKIKLNIFNNNIIKQMSIKTIKINLSARNKRKKLIKKLKKGESINE